MGDYIVRATAANYQGICGYYQGPGGVCQSSP